MTGSLSIVVCINIDPPIKPMEQREEIKKEKNTAATGLPELLAIRTH
jgi:hypothetical protein